MLIEYINMKNNEMMRLVLIVVAACVFIYLIHSYNNTNNLEQENFFADAKHWMPLTTAIILLKNRCISR